MYLITALRRFIPIVLLASSASVCTGETLTTIDGKQYTGKIGGIYGPVVLVSSKTSSSLLSLEQLDDASFALVASKISASAEQSGSWNESRSPVAQALKGRLTQLSDGKLVDYVPSGPEPEFYLIYFSAHWCGPCRRFTPSLVEQYNRLKEGTQGSRFELIFVSSDRGAAEQQKYIAEAKMPWPALKYSQIGKARVVERWAGNGIPCLVVLNRDGELLYHSYRGYEYLGPSVPLQAFTDLLSALDPNHPMTRKARYRLAMKEWMESARTADAQPKPYYISLNRPMYPRAGKLVFEVVVDVDANGRVADVVSCGDASSDVASHLRRDSRDWLFLPAAQGGKAVPGRVSVPISL